jgi:hypothetical protein
VVQPIKNEGKVIGAVIVGTLLNQIIKLLIQYPKAPELKHPYFLMTRKSAPTFPIQITITNLAQLGHGLQQK